MSFKLGSQMRLRTQPKANVRANVGGWAASSFPLNLSSKLKTEISLWKIIFRVTFLKRHLPAQPGKTNHLLNASEKKQLSRQADS